LFYRQRENFKQHTQHIHNHATDSQQHLKQIKFTEQNWEDLTRMRIEPNPYKGMTPPSTQNLGFMGLLSYMLLNFLIATQCGT